MSAPVLSIVVPTYNEAENVGRLVEELQALHAGRDVEILVVDDDSRDGTAQVARDAGARVIVRTGERGLATAVVRGIEEARGTFALVMDADLQHPPEVTRRMLDRALSDEADLVVGSRYTQGGSEGGFAWHRRIISWGAAALARTALPPVRKHRITDPMSGLFLVRKDRVPTGALRPTGYKILLELLAKGDLRRVSEVGYTFGARAGGESKLGAAVIVQYLLHVLALGLQHPDNRRVAKFGLVGGSGIVVNLGILWALTELAGLHYVASAAISVETSILWNFLWNDRWTFHDRRHDHFLVRVLRFNAVSLAALGLNLLTLTVLTEWVGLYYLVSEFFAILVTFTFNYMGNLHWTYGDAARFRLRSTARDWSAWLPFGLLVVASLGVYLDDIGRADEIYFDEHYYVSVAYQISNGIWEDPCWENDQELPHRPLNFEHPPLAKLLIAWSVHTLDPDQGVFEGCRQPDGDAYKAFTQSLRDESDPIYWRLPSALFGTATVAFAGLAAGRLFRSPGAAVLAGGLTLLDGVVFTSSRMAILDIFATGFALAALYAATFPSKRGIAAAAVLLGLGFASKFTVLFLGLPVLLVSLYCQRRAGVLSRRRFDGTLAALALTPIPILLLSYLPWWILWAPEGIGWAVRHWFDVQVAAVTWGATVQSGHAYASPPAQWFLMERPVFYYAMWNVRGVPDLNRYIYGVGNPVVWWSAAAAVLLTWTTTAIAWVRRRAWTPDQGTLLVGTAVPALAYGGFLVLTRESFLFYMTIVVPLLAVALAGACMYAWKHHPTAGRIGVAALVMLAVGAFALYYPVVAGTDLSIGTFRTIMDAVPWMRS